MRPALTMHPASRWRLSAGPQGRDRSHELTLHAQTRRRCEQSNRPQRLLTLQPVLYLSGLYQSRFHLCQDLIFVPRRFCSG